MSGLLFYDIKITFMDYDKFSGSIEMPTKQSFFPMCLNHPKNYDMISLPDIKYFFNKCDTELIRQSKTVFYQKQSKNWNFIEALREHLKNEVLCLMNNSLKVVDLCNDIQNMLKNVMKLNVPYIHPLNCLSISQFGYTLFQRYCLKDADVRTVKNEYGVTNGNCSSIQFFFEHWTKWKNPEKTVISAFLSSSGPKKFGKRMSVDCFIEEEQKAIELFGCYHHGCIIPQCKIRPKNNDQNKKLWESSVERLKDLSKKFNINFEIWPQCQFEKILKHDCENNGFQKPKFYGKPHRD